MKTHKSILILILLTVLTIGSCKKNNPQEPIPQESNTQEPTSGMISIAGINYAQYDSVWFTVVDGRKGDLVNFAKLIVKPNSGVNMQMFDYQSIGVPNLDIIAFIANEYYVLNTSQLNDPFEVAQKMWNAGKFIYLAFDVLIPVTGINTCINHPTAIVYQHRLTRRSS
jgi:hypothetical protein